MISRDYISSPADFPQINAMTEGLQAGDTHACDAMFRTLKILPPRIILSPTTSELSDPHFTFLLNHWEKLRNCDVNTLPHYKHIDPVKLKPCLGYIHLVDVMPDGFNFFYRLYGSAICELATRDWTGWTLAAQSIALGSGVGPFHQATYRFAPFRARRFIRSTVYQRRYRCVGGAASCCRLLMIQVPSPDLWSAIVHANLLLAENSM